MTGSRLPWKRTATCPHSPSKFSFRCHPPCSKIRGKGSLSEFDSVPNTGLWVSSRSFLSIKLKTEKLRNCPLSKFQMKLVKIDASHNDGLS